MMHVRIPHPACEPDDGEPFRWAPLLILAASFAIWATIILGGRYLVGLFIGA